MYILIAILIFIVCLLLMVVVLVQNSKGGGLSSSFGGGNQVLGVRKTTDFLEKATWGLAITLLSLCLLSSAFAPDVVTTQSSELQDKVQSEAIQQPVQNPNAAPLPKGQGQPQQQTQQAPPVQQPEGK